MASEPEEMSSFNSSKETRPHSADYFNGQRDHWWNSDFLALMAKRWRLGEAKRALDVGCGVGHWVQALHSFFRRDAEILGIDRESEWVTAARQRSGRLGLQNCRFEQGNAESLPVSNASFDLVMCQTLLIHVREPEKVIGEMVRAVRPGGLVVAVEPNVMAGALVFGSSDFRSPIADIVERVRFQLTCERGKEALGEGNCSIGEMIPGYFSAAGLVEVSAHIADKASLLVPPYCDPEQKVEVEQALSWSDQDFWLWNRQDTRRYFLAGGGEQEKFDECWALVRELTGDFLRAMEAGTYHCAGGRLLYLVSGRKPQGLPSPPC